MLQVGRSSRPVTTVERSPGTVSASGLPPPVTTSNQSTIKQQQWNRSHLISDEAMSMNVLKEIRTKYLAQGKWIESIEKLSSWVKKLRVPHSRVSSSTTMSHTSTSNHKLKPNRVSPILIQLLNQRAQCYYRMSEYNACLTDDAAILELEPNHSEANERKVKCLFGLKQYSLADQSITQLTQLTASIPFGSTIVHQEGSSAVLKSLIKLQEQILRETSGHFDMDSIRQECLSLLTPTINIPANEMKILTSITDRCPCGRLGPHADYVHSAIECISITNKGYGLRIKSESDGIISIPKDTLLLCCKAVGVRLKSDSQDAVQLLKRKLQDQPDLNQQVQRLFSQPKCEKQRMKLMEQISPIALLQQPVSLSTTSLSSKSYSSHPWSMDDLQLRLAWNRNSFSDSIHSSWSDTYGLGGESLWLLPSMINHSCLPNCRWFVFGDLMFVHSNRTIEPGEELSITYRTHPTDSFCSRQHILMKNWRFQCQCQYCHFYHESPILIMKEKQLDEECHNLESLLQLSETNKVKLTTQQLMNQLQVLHGVTKAWSSLAKTPPESLTDSKLDSSSSSSHPSNSSTSNVSSSSTLASLAIDPNSPLALPLLHPYQLELKLIASILSDLSPTSLAADSYRSRQLELELKVKHIKERWNT